MRRLSRNGGLILAALGAAAFAPSAPAADFSWPTTGRISSTYWNWRPSYYHKAIDIAAPKGTRVGASRSGKIVFRGWDDTGSLTVTIGHGSGYRSSYKHNSRLSAARGAVSRGTIIAYVGQTGNATGPHTHLHIERYGTRVYIPGRLYQQVRRGDPIRWDYPGL